MKKNICFLVCLIVSFVLFSCKRGESIKTITCENSSLGSGGIYPQRFHVEGNLIVDESGEQVVLRGLNVLGPVTQEKDPVNTEYTPWNEAYYKEAASWGAKIIRVPIEPGLWRNYGHQENFMIIDQTIEWAEKYGMYVILDCHGIGFPTSNEYEEDKEVEGNYTINEEQLLDFWEAFSIRYGTNKTVAFFDIFNEITCNGCHSTTDIDKSFEPDYLEDWNAWKIIAERIIDTIRMNASETPVLVSSLYYANYGHMIINDPIEKENIIYNPLCI